METQWHKSNGEVMLSRWWKTPSARAAFRRVEQANKLAYAKQKAKKQAEAKLKPVALSLTKPTRKVRRKR